MPGPRTPPAASPVTAMSRRALVFQHFNDDTPGRIGALIEAMDIRCDIVALHRGDEIPALAPYEAMLVLGGTQQAWQEEEFPWLSMEKQAIREWVGARAKPYFGICFGHQLLAAALGGEVGYASAPEIGVSTIAIAGEDGGHPFMAGLGGTHQVMQWHSAEVKSLPAQAIALAASTVSPIQAMAVDNHAIGVQFHCEWTLERIHHWGTLPTWTRALDAAYGSGGHARFVAACTPAMPAIEAMTDRLFDNFRRTAKL
jgi:GMP synthase-like glutamine amidotransferase